MPDESLAMPDESLAMPDKSLAMPDESLATPDESLARPDESAAMPMSPLRCKNKKQCFFILNLVVGTVILKNMRTNSFYLIHK